MSRGLSWSDWGRKPSEKCRAWAILTGRGKDCDLVNHMQTQIWLQMLLENGGSKQK